MELCVSAYALCVLIFGCRKRRPESDKKRISFGAIDRRCTIHTQRHGTRMCSIHNTEEYGKKQNTSPVRLGFVLLLAIVASLSIGHSRQFRKRRKKGNKIIELSLLIDRLRSNLCLYSGCTHSTKTTTTKKNANVNRPCTCSHLCGGISVKTTTN